MEVFLLVLSMWGKDADDTWIYIGNQWVLNHEMTEFECQAMIADDNWIEHNTNEYYKIQFGCHKKGTEL